MSGYQSYESTFAPEDDRRIIPLSAVCVKTGLCKSTVYKLIAAGSFPRPIKLTTRRSGWLVCEIDGWLTARAKARTNEVRK